MTAMQERFANQFVVNVLREHIGFHGISREEAADIIGITPRRLSAILDGATYLRAIELLNLIADPRFQTVLSGLVQPMGYVVKRPTLLNNPCPKHLTTLSAQATSINATASEDGVIDHIEMPDVANANRRYAEYYYAFIASQSRVANS